MTAPGVVIVSETSTFLSITFDSTMENVDKVCDKALVFVLDKITGTRKDLFSIHLALREGLINAVKHGNNEDPKKTVNCRVICTTQDSVAIEIQDQGKGFDWQARTGGAPDSCDEHGRGLVIIQHYASEYTYNDRGNRLMFKKHLGIC
ncbi:MAG: ATP-binding protein [Desulfobacteraceae bacterium]